MDEFESFLHEPKCKPEVLRRDVVHYLPVIMEAHMFSVPLLVPNVLVENFIVCLYTICPMR
jgi:hypothetical protein